MRESHRDERAVIKFYCLRKKSNTKTSEKMRVYGDSSFCQAIIQLAQNVFEWERIDRTATCSVQRTSNKASCEVNVNTRVLIERIVQSPAMR